MSKFDNPQPTPTVHLEWWEKCSSEHPLVAIAAPRGHAKSTAITHSYTLANLCFREASFILIASDTETQAVMFLGDIKNELIENEKLRELFGIKRLIKDTETDVIGEFTDGQKFRIMAKGSGQSLRGVKWNGKRPDLIVGDDLENDEIVMNEDRRAKFRRWMNNALIPTLADHGKIRIVGTILHLDSFLERCMPEFEDQEHTETDGVRWWSNKPLLDVDPEKMESITEEQLESGRVWDSIRYQGHDSEFKTLLWPEKFSAARYKFIRARYVRDGNPEGYAQEYLNYPIDESTAYFQKKDFLPWKDKDEYLEYYIGGDLAISEKDQRAYTVFVVAGLNRDNRLVVVDVERFRGDGQMIINTMFNLQNKYSPEIFFLEEENIARSLGSVIDSEMIRRGVFINFDTTTPTKDKMQRARALQARMRAGGVLFDMEKEWYPSLFNEMVTFPRGKFMDQVDALSWIGLGINKLVPAYTKSEIAAFEYDEEFGDELVSLGRNQYTGY